MSQLTINLPQEAFERLRREAERAGKPVETLASQLLSDRLPPAALSERERAREVLRVAGLLAESTPEMLAIAAQSTATLAEVQAAFARVGGQPLSEVVSEQRGPKA